MDVLEGVDVAVVVVVHEPHIRGQCSCTMSAIKASEAAWDLHSRASTVLQSSWSSIHDAHAILAMAGTPSYAVSPGMRPLLLLSPMLPTE